MVLNDVFRIQCHKNHIGEQRIKKYCQHHAVSGATTLQRIRPVGLAWDVIITALLNREKNHSQETKCGTKIHHLL